MARADPWTLSRPENLGTVIERRPLPASEIHTGLRHGAGLFIDDPKATSTMDSSSDQFSPRQEATSGESEAELRTRALERLKAKQVLRGHIVLYVAVNLMLIVIWWVTGAGFFWPVFPILGWGVGLAYNLWEVMSPQPGPDTVRAEMDRLRRQQN